jgi:hypothetical protein
VPEIIITVTESERESIAGFPKSIELETDIPASIFYTSNGTNPTEDSDIYFEAIILPTNVSTITYKFFATNGSDVSQIIERTYSNSFNNIKLKQSKITNYNDLLNNNLAPFGDGLNQQAPILSGTSGQIVDDSSIENYLDGYDENQNFVGSVDVGLEESLQLVYSQTDDQGTRERGIGTFTATSFIRRSNEVPAQSDFNSKFFNPKASVIFQSSDDVENQDINTINHKAFALYDPRKNISSFFAGGTSSLQSPGGMLRQHFNPKDQTLNYYYFDSKSLRWVISKEKYHHKTNNNYSNIILSSRSHTGGAFIFKWYPFMRYKII